MDHILCLNRSLRQAEFIFEICYSSSWDDKRFPYSHSPIWKIIVKQPTAVHHRASCAYPVPGLQAHCSNTWQTDAHAGITRQHITVNTDISSKHKNRALYLYEEQGYILSGVSWGGLRNPTWNFMWFMWYTVQLLSCENRQHSAGSSLTCIICSPCIYVMSQQSDWKIHTKMSLFMSLYLFWLQELFSVPSTFGFVNTWSLFIFQSFTEAFV